MTDRDNVPEPCTAAARDQGCTCRMSWVDSATIDPPHEIVNPNCPLHGVYQDPDEARDRLIEDREWWEQLAARDDGW